MTFAEFKAGQPACEMFERLGLSGYLKAAENWRMLRALVIEFNDPDQGRFVARVRRLDGVVSSGERILLHAICYACDFAWLADELAAGKAWQRMNRASGDWTSAVAACIEAWE